MVELDLEKILSLPDELSQQTELSAQIEESLAKFDSHIPISDRESALIGFISSLVMNIMIVREYTDYISNSFNQFCAAAQTPFIIFNFADFADTRKMNNEQMREWLEQKNEKWRNRQREQAGRIITLDK